MQADAGPTGKGPVLGSVKQILSDFRDVLELSGLIDNYDEWKIPCKHLPSTVLRFSEYNILVKCNFETALDYIQLALTGALDRIEESHRTFSPEKIVGEPLSLFDSADRSRSSCCLVFLYGGFKAIDSILADLFA